MQFVTKCCRNQLFSMRSPHNCARIEGIQDYCRISVDYDIIQEFSEKFSKYLKSPIFFKIIQSSFRGIIEFQLNFILLSDWNFLAARSRLVSGTLVLAVLPDAPVAAGHVPAVRKAVLLGTDTGRGERPASCPTRSTSGPVGQLPIFGKISAKCRSFSAVSAPICASKYAFCSIFQNLPDYHAENFEICQNLANFTTFANFLLNLHENCCFFKPIFCENFEIAAVQKDANLVELEKCCQMHIFLQNFVFIQPRTSPPKICKILLIFPILLTLTPNP